VPPNGTRRTSRREVYETLRREVLTLGLAPGAALSENELAARLGVSRTPIRESLVLLVEEGLVQVFPKIGSFVSRVDPARVADAQFVREAIELAALQDLPGEPDPAVVAELRENLAAQQRPGLDQDAFFELDEAFHQGLLRLSGHGSAWTTVVSAKGHLDRARRLGLSESPPTEYAAQHVRILDAVLSGDTGSAHAAMRGHLRAVFDDIERIRERSPELFSADPASVPVRRSVVVWE
jgi:DNA-binding GntR family transcriptional regulator